jgi:hypothetical protein
MATPRASRLSSDVWAKRVNGVATLALFGAVLGGAYASGRVYRRWSKDVNVLTAPRARVEKIRTDYRYKKANALEWGAIAGTLAVDIAMAAREARPR